MGLTAFGGLFSFRPFNVIGITTHYSGVQLASEENRQLIKYHEIEVKIFYFLLIQKIEFWGLFVLSKCILS